MEEKPSGGVPQFATAEYSSQSGTAVCKSCGQAIRGAHYRVNGVLTCANCAERIRQQVPKDSHAAFVRGISFGVAGAVLGLVIYVAFALSTGWVIGYISLAVGYIVGQGITLGSRGLGRPIWGRRRRPGSCHLRSVRTLDRLGDRLHLARRRLYRRQGNHHGLTRARRSPLPGAGGVTDRPRRAPGRWCDRGA